MKKIAFILITLTALASCQKEDHNGDLGGFWKLQQIELADSIINTREKSCFWAVQLDLIQIGNGKGRFQHVSDSLYIQMITMPSDPKSLGLFNPKDERFGVIHLDRNGMVLRSKDATLTLKKF
ncbi:MAG: lipocalin-like domain-containing protein [Bacteroidaceae bacterium]|nr:lipocalin-like domain-containing protein [Bacteroidaceae bacterium]